MEDGKRTDPVVKTDEGVKKKDPADLLDVMESRIYNKRVYVLNGNKRIKKRQIWGEVPHDLLQPFAVR